MRTPAPDQSALQEFGNLVCMKSAQSGAWVGTLSIKDGRPVPRRNLARLASRAAWPWSADRFPWVESVLFRTALGIFVYGMLVILNLENLEPSVVTYGVIG